MANASLFRSIVGALIPKTDARHAEHAPAYARSPEQALAQFAATGCLNTTFYATAEEQLDRVLAFSSRTAPEFVARAAIYCRERGFMKDMPALLLVAVSRRDPRLMDRIFDRTGCAVTTTDRNARGTTSVTCSRLAHWLSGPLNFDAHRRGECMREYMVYSVRLRDSRTRFVTAALGASAAECLREHTT